jgi:hypothetical protein
VTGTDGEVWAGGELGVPLQVLADDTLAAAYHLGPGSAVLVRPDGRVAWRSDAAVAEPRAVLAGAVAMALGHAAVPAALAG